MMGAANPTMTDPKYNAHVIGLRKLMMKRKYPKPPINMDHFGPIRATTGGANLAGLGPIVKLKKISFSF